ncbi:MAG: hypothetical protein WD825_03690 [Gemmatimonadaceae bacterium]
MSRVVLLSLVLVLAACGRQAQVGTAPASSRSDAITGADQLLAAMHDRYAGKWYRNLTFVQKSTYLRPDGRVSRVETWYEAGAIPGRLRIDFGEPSRGMGVLYRNDSAYTMAGGRVTVRQAGRNLLLVLGFDVYGQPPARTLAQLRAERIDLSVLRTDMLDGKRVYVVGAGPRDSTSNQFWVEADRLLFVRLIQTDTARRRTQDIRFGKYVAHGGGWVAEDVRVMISGFVALREEYSDVRVNVPLDSNLFVPEQWSMAQHWHRR